MEEYLSRTRKSAVIRLAEMCNKIWDIIREMWINRCDQEHNNEESEINIKRNEDSNKKIDEIYNKLPAMRTLPMSDRSFFNKDREWRKKQRLKEKVKWVKRASIIIKAYGSIGEISAEARLMREYFLATD